MYRPIDVRQFSLRLLSTHRPGRRGTVVRRLTRGLATLPQGATRSSGQRQKWKTSKRTSCQPLVINCFCVFVGGSAWSRPKHDMYFCLSRLILRFWACFLYISLLLLHWFLVFLAYIVLFCSMFTSQVRYECWQQPFWTSVKQLCCVALLPRTAV